MNSVVAIGNRDEAGEVSWVASGFFYGRFRRTVTDTANEYGTFLVTNKHVLQGLTKPVIRANPVGDAPAAELDLNFVDEVGAPLWVEHPDLEVDVVVTAIHLDMLRDLGLQVGFFQDDQSASTEKIQSLGISEGDSVFLFGFPMGIVGGVRSAVVVRGGVMAQLQGLLEGASKSFIVDGYVFPGNSGGPVVTKPEVISIAGTSAVSSAYLIGVVASYIPFQDVAISAQTGRNRIVFEENSGLSNVFPVECIDQAIDVWELAHPHAAETEVADAEAPPTVDEPDPAASETDG